MFNKHIVDNSRDRTERNRLCETYFCFFAVLKEKQDVMRTNRIKVHTPKAWCYIAFSLFFIMLMSSCRNRVMASSNNLNQRVTTAAVHESDQDVVSNRIIYSPNGDIVDEEGIYNDEPLDTNAVYIVVEDMPEFPGGTSAILDYLSKNVRYPEACRKDSIQGRVIIFFVVERDGSISNAEVIKSVHEQLDAEALRVVRAMPKWKPGRQRGVALRVRYGIPVNFRLDGSGYVPVSGRTAEIIEIVEEDITVVME